MVAHDDSRLDKFLAGAEKRARSARLLSIALTIIPVAIGVLFLLITFKQVKNARMELAQIETDLTVKKKELEEKNAELGEKAKQLEFFGLTFEQVPRNIQKEAINRALTSSPQIAGTVPVVYLHIWNESQRAAAKQAENKLQKNGYVVPGIENVGAKAPFKNELRHFHGTQQETDDIKDITGILQSLNVAAEPKLLGNIRVKARTYELWFAQDREILPSSRGSIGDIEPTRLSSNELKVKVQYTYADSVAPQTVIMVAGVLQANGEPVPGTSYAAGSVRPGTNSVVVTIEKTGNSEPYKSAKLNVCMRVAGGKDIVCKTVAHAMDWK